MRYTALGGYDVIAAVDIYDIVTAAIIGITGYAAQQKQDKKYYPFHF